MVHIGAIPDADARMAETTRQAFDAVLTALQPGNRARDESDGPNNRGTGSQA
jgi:hypothetical protein